MTRDPEAWTLAQAMVALPLALVYVPAFVVLRPGWAWEIVRALLAVGWERLTTTSEPTTTR